jgi:putative cardiolipin synthase
LTDILLVAGLSNRVNLVILYDIHETMKNSLIKNFILAFCFFFLVFGCASLPKDYERQSSSAFKHPETTYLGKFFSKSMAKHPGQSGYVLLNTGKEAFISRLAFTEIAERSIDAQYFIWKGDVSGRIFTERLIRAAGRGVHVRILVDDIHAGERDFRIAALDTHPNIDVRLFNPFGNRSLRILRNVEFIFDLSRLSHRMHNKLFVVDNQVAIVGGRNIGNEYFGLNPKFNFHDLELLAAGPIVEDISEGFDTYWNSTWAVPISALDGKKPTPEEADSLYQKLRSFVENQHDFPYDINFTNGTVMQTLELFHDRFIWAKGEVIYDKPDKVTGDVSSNLADALWMLGENIQHEVLMSSPYLSPAPRALEKIKEMTGIGVTYRLLTNSLASTDSVPAHSIYAKYRKKLLQQGVEVYELRPDAMTRSIHNADTVSEARLSLHAKAVIYDQKIVYVGSYNFNKAGRDLSMETGLIVYSPELAEQAIAVIEEDMKPENSWQVVLDEHNDNQTNPNRNSGFVWITEIDGKQVLYDYEPRSDIWRDLGNAFFSFFPLGDKL